MRLPTWTSTRSGDLIDMGILLDRQAAPTPVYDANPRRCREDVMEAGIDPPSRSSAYPLLTR